VRKAVIAVPPVRDFYFTPNRASALGARVLLRELKEAGWDSVLMNLPLIEKSRTISLPCELEYLTPFLIPDESGPLSWFTAYHHFGPSFSETAEMIARENPELLLISSFAWAYAGEARKLAEAAAVKMPNLRIVIGGHGPTALPEFFLNSVHPVFPDTALFAGVVSGEIEGYGELILSLKSESRFLDLRKMKTTEELKPIAGESICRAGRRSISIMLTRGCPRNCRFCSNFICHGRKFRSSPAKLWKSEVTRAAKESGEPSDKLHLNIEDDNILFLKNDFFSFLETLRTLYPDISFSAENGLDYMLLDEEDIPRLKDWGFTHLNLSLAVLSEESRGKEKREGNPEKLEGLIHRCKTVELPVTTHFICGLAGDSTGDIVKTLRFLDRLPTQTGISNFYPVPGLEGFTDKELFLKNPPKLALGSSVFPWNTSMSSSQMITAFRLARWSNFRKKHENEDKLYTRIKETRRIHTIIRGKRTIIPVPNLDNDMVEAFFS